MCGCKGRALSLCKNSSFTSMVSKRESVQVPSFGCHNGVCGSGFTREF